MDISSFEKDVIFDWLRSIKRSVLNISESLEQNASNSEKMNQLLQKLLEMLENK